MNVSTDTDTRHHLQDQQRKPSSANAATPNSTDTADTANTRINTKGTNTNTPACGDKTTPTPTPTPTSPPRTPPTPSTAEPQEQTPWRVSSSLKPARKRGEKSLISVPTKHYQLETILLLGGGGRAKRLGWQQTPLLRGTIVNRTKSCQ